jgi:hypothetical protein
MTFIHKLQIGSDASKMSSDHKKNYRMKLRLTLLLSLALSLNAFGQDSKTATVTDAAYNLLTWVKHLNSDVDKYFSPAKGEEMSRYLGLFRQELTNYMKTRKTLADSLLRNNITPGKKDEASLEVLKQRMSNVMTGMRSVTDFVSDDLRAEGDKLNDEIYNAYYGDHPRFLSHLEALLSGADVTKKDLAVESSVGYQRLEECINLIQVIQAKIDKRMKK